MSRAWEAVPGVPAAGHVTGGGAWHPGRAEGCVKCSPPRPRPAGGTQAAHAAAGIFGGRFVTDPCEEGGDHDCRFSHCDCRGHRGRPRGAVCGRYEGGDR